MLSPCEYEVYLEHPVCVTVMSAVAEGYRISTGELTGCIVSLLPFEFTFIRTVFAHRYGLVAFAELLCVLHLAIDLAYAPAQRATAVASVTLAGGEGGREAGNVSRLDNILPAPTMHAFVDMHDALPVLAR